MIHVHQRTWFIFLLVPLLTACSGPRVMMPTPNIYVDSGTTDTYSGLHQNLKSTEVPLFYITDRAPEQDENGNLKYGYMRSTSLAFGSTVVDLGEDITWEQLLEASRTDKRLDDVKMEVRELNDIVRRPTAPPPYN